MKFLIEKLQNGFILEQLRSPTEICDDRPEKKWAFSTLAELFLKIGSICQETK